MHTIDLVDNENQRLVIRRLFGEYQRGVERLLSGSGVCP